MTTTRKPYPTDINDTAWEKIKPLLPHFDDANRRKYPLREIVNAIFYFVRNGISWRAMPHDLPPHGSVWGYYSKWGKNGVLEGINTVLVDAHRVKMGREAEPSLLLIDSQSVKSACGGEEIGIDGNKKVHGRKKHPVTDTQGNLLAIKVTSANVADQVGGEQALKILYDRTKETKGSAPSRIIKVLADKAYQGIVDLVKEKFGWELEIVSKPEGQKGFVPQPIRWVIERFHAWQGYSRRLSKDYERTVCSSEAMSYLASIERLARKMA